VVLSIQLFDRKVKSNQIEGEQHFVICRRIATAETKVAIELVLFSWDVGVVRKGHALHLPSAHTHIPTHKNPNLCPA
jgi:hypothetical protein